MDKCIRYAWGQSPNGRFLVVMDGSELVTFGFPTDEDAAIGDLRNRFPGAAIEEDTAGLERTVVQLTHFVGYFNPKAKKG